MTKTEALALLQGWAGNESYSQSLKVDPNGDFLGKSRGAFFRFSAEKSRLVVSGLVRYDSTIHSEHPETWARLEQAAERESATMGDGKFELYSAQLYDFAPEIVLLSKTFESGGISQDQFNEELRWLLTAATHWRTLRYNRVMQDPDDVVERDGRLLNERMLRERPRPW